MRLIADYHTHTVFSHGKGTVHDNVEAAVRRGLSAVGIADHSMAHLAHGIKKSGFPVYMSRLEEAKRSFSDRIEVKTGIELNLTGLDGSVDWPAGADFDMVILGYHKSAVVVDIRSAWTFHTGNRFGHVNGITRAYMRAIQKQKIDIVAHPGYGVPVDYRMIAKACADYGTLFEISNKHTELTEEHLRTAAGEGARFVVSSDAHSPQKVGEVSQALALAIRAGIVDRIVNVMEDKS